jgi:hypothetical protein
MSGHNAFEQVVAFADGTGQARPLISREDFEEWREYYIWDALHGVRYGQSFCNRFNITDHILYYVINECKEADIYIEKHYVEKNQVS